MSYEKQTRIKPDLPEGDVTVVVQVANLANQPYNNQHASFLQETLFSDKAQPANKAAVDAPRIIALDGALYAEIRTHGIDYAEAVARSAKLLYGGLAHVAFDTAEIFAHADATVEVSPHRSLDQTFPYLKEDVTLELRHDLEELSYGPPDTSAMDTELYAMLDA